MDLKECLESMVGKTVLESGLTEDDEFFFTLSDHRTYYIYSGDDEDLFLNMEVNAPS